MQYCSMKQRTTLLVVGSIIVGVLVIVGVLTMVNKSSATPNQSSNNTAVLGADGQQTIEITARGGYSPRYVEAQANTPVTLVMKTRNAYDCSIALVIPKLKVRQNLPITGDTPFAIPPQAPGTEITGTCTMGMYFFKIKFI